MNEITEKDKNKILSILFDGYDYGVIVVDVNMNIVLWNSWVSDKSGVDYPAVVGKMLLSVFPELKKSRLISLITDVFNKGFSSMLSHALNKAPFPFYDSRGATSKIKHAIYVKPINLSDDVRYCAIQVVDVTAALHREKQLADLAERAQQAKLEAEKLSQLKSGFISTVSHELRTPLTSMRGSLGLMLGGAIGEMPAKSIPLLEIAQRNAERLLLLVNDILDMEKIESGRLDFHYAPLDVKTFLESAREASKGYVDQYGVTLDMTVEDADVTIYADSHRLMQVMNNLISNAAKFSSQGSIIEMLTIRRGDKVRISVTDYGSGIPESFQGALFDKFTQADTSTTRTSGGTGLGLSISKEIVEKHGGELEFITQEDVGTTFYFELFEWVDDSKEMLLEKFQDITD